MFNVVLSDCNKEYLLCISFIFISKKGYLKALFKTYFISWVSIQYNLQQIRHLGNIQ